MRVPAMILAFILVRPVFGQDKPESCPLSWRLEKGRRILQTVTIAGTSEAYGAEGLRMSVSLDLVDTSERYSRFNVKVGSFKALSGGRLPVKLEYADGEWKQFSFFDVDRKKDPGARPRSRIEKDLKDLFTKEFEFFFYAGDEISTPIELIVPFGELRRSLLLDVDLPGLEHGLYPPTFGLSLQLAPERPVGDQAVEVGQEWKGDTDAAKFKLEGIETVEGKRCARIAATAQRKRAAIPQSRTATYWFAIEEGYVAKASLAVRVPDPADGAKTLRAFTVDVSTTSGK